jgi:hypothetical protein
MICHKRLLSATEGDAQQHTPDAVERKKLVYDLLW